MLAGLASQFSNGHSWELLQQVNQDGGKAGPANWPGIWSNDTSQMNMAVLKQLWKMILFLDIKC